MSFILEIEQQSIPLVSPIMQEKLTQLKQQLEGNTTFTTYSLTESTVESSSSSTSKHAFSNEEKNILARFESDIKAIAARNQLIAQLALDTSPPKFDPWTDTLLAYLNEYASATTARDPVSRLTYPNAINKEAEELIPLIDAMGAQGLRALLKAAFKISKATSRKAFTQCHLYVRGLNALEILKMVNEVQKEEGSNLPFNELSIRQSESPPYEKAMAVDEFEKEVKAFLSRNSFIESFEVTHHHLILNPQIVLIKENQLGEPFINTAPCLEEAKKNYQGFSKQVVFFVEKAFDLDKAHYVLCKTEPQKSELKENTIYIYPDKTSAYSAEGALEETFSCKLKKGGDSAIATCFQPNADENHAIFQALKQKYSELSASNHTQMILSPENFKNLKDIKALSKNIAKQTLNNGEGRFSLHYFNQTGELVSKSLKEQGEHKALCEQVEKLKEGEDIEATQRACFYELKQHQSEWPDLSIVSSVDELQHEKTFCQFLKENQIITSLAITEPSQQSFHLKMNAITVENRRKDLKDAVAQQKRTLEESIEMGSDYPAYWFAPRQEERQIPISFSVSVSHPLSQQVTAQQNNTFSQNGARQEKIAQQIGRQQSQQQNQKKSQQERAQAIHFPVLSNHLIDDSKIIDPIQKQLWFNLIGEKDKVVDYVTQSAWMLVQAQREAFQSGVMPHNLPAGFFIIEKPLNGKEQKILGYDPQYQRKDQTPLTCSLSQTSDHSFDWGGAEQFYTEETSAQEKKDIDLHFDRLKKSAITPPPQSFESFLFLVSKLPDGQAVVESLHKQPRHLEILKKLFFNPGDMVNVGTSITALTLEKGALGLAVFIEKLAQLDKQPGLFESFYVGFIENKKNLFSLSTRETFQKMDYLCSLSVSELNWWNTLILQQAKARRAHFLNNTSLIEMVSAFRYFCDEIKALGTAEKPVTLPPRCEVDNAQCMPVVLERLLYILKNAADPLEQMAEIGALSLDREGAYFAIEQDKFNFVSGEMQLEPDIYELNLIETIPDNFNIAKFKTKAFLLVQDRPGQMPSALYYVNKKSDPRHIAEVTSDPQALTSILKLFFPNQKTHDYAAIPALSNQQVLDIVNTANYQLNEPLEQEKLSYRIDSTDLLIKASTSSLAQFKKYFFRYVGGQAPLYEYRHYLDLWTAIKEARGNNASVRIDKTALAASVALCSVGEDIFKADPEDFISQLKHNRLFAVQAEKVSGLLKIAMEKKEAPLSLTLFELEGLYTFQQAFREQILSKSEKPAQEEKQLSAFVAEYGQAALIVLSNLGYRNEGNGQNIADLMGTLRFQERECPSHVAQLNAQGLILLSLLHSSSKENYKKVHELKQTLQELLKNRSPDFVCNLLANMNQVIEVKKNKNYPTLDDIIFILNKSETGSLSEVKYLLKERNASIRFTSFKKQAFKKINTHEMLLASLADSDMIQVLSSLGVNPKELAEQLKKNTLSLSALSEAIEKRAKSNPERDTLLKPTILGKVKNLFLQALSQKIALILTPESKNAYKLQEQIAHYLGLVGTLQNTAFFARYRESEALLTTLLKLNTDENKASVLNLIELIFEAMKTKSIAFSDLLSILENKEYTLEQKQDLFNLLIQKRGAVQQVTEWLKKFNQQAIEVKKLSFDTLLSIFSFSYEQKTPFGPMKCSFDFNALNHIMDIIQWAHDLIGNTDSSAARYFLKGSKQQSWVISLLSEFNYDPQACQTCLNKFNTAIQDKKLGLSQEDKVNLLPILRRVIPEYKNITMGIINTFLEKLNYTSQAETEERTNEQKNRSDFIAFLSRCAEQTYFPPFEDSILEAIDNINFLDKKALEQIKIAIKKEISQHEKDPFGNIRQFLKFDADKIKKQISLINNRFHNLEPSRDEEQIIHPLPEGLQDSLFKQIKSVKTHINNICLHNTDQMLKTDIARLKALLTSNITHTSEQTEAILCHLLACFCVAYFRTQSTADKPQFLSDEQILATLISIFHSGAHSEEITSGEGKSLIMGIRLALSWAKGRTAHCATKEYALSEKACADNQKFFEFIGAKSGVIYPDSPRKAHQLGGIYFSTHAGHSLYRQRMELAGTPIHLKEYDGDFVAPVATFSTTLISPAKPILSSALSTGEQTKKGKPKKESIDISTGDMTLDSASESESEQEIFIPEAQAAEPIFDLVADEAEEVLYGDLAQYIVSGGEEVYFSYPTNPDEWIFPIVNRFVDYLDELDARQAGDLPNPTFMDFDFFFKTSPQREVREWHLKTKQAGRTVYEEVNALLQFLNVQADLLHENKDKLTQKNFPKELNIWIRSARRARDLKAGEDYLVVEDYEYQGRTYSYAKILQGKVKEGAQWKNGLHQCLHARLEENRKNNGLPNPPFLCEHERKTQSLSNSQDSLDFYEQTGGQIMGFMRSAGSASEVKQVRRQYQMDIYEIPIQQENGTLVRLSTEQKAFDKRNKQAARVQQSYIDVMAYVQFYLNTIQQSFPKDDSQQKLKKEFSTYRQNLLETLDERWQDALILNKGNMALVVGDFKKTAQSLLNQAHKIWSKKITQKTDAPELFKALTVRNKRLKKQLKAKQTFKDSIFLSQLATVTPANIKQRFFPLLRMQTTEKDLLALSHQNREEEKVLYQKMLESIVHSMQEYRENLFLASDRKEDSKQLLKYAENELERLKNADEKKCDWLFLRQELTAKFNHSLAVDLELEASLCSARKVHSRFRHRIVQLKGMLLALCPNEFFAQTVKKKKPREGVFFHELSWLKDYVYQLMEEGIYYQKHPQLNARLQDLHGVLTRAFDHKQAFNAANTLIAIRHALDLIYRHPDYKKEETELSWLNNYIDFLSARALRTFSLEEMSLWREFKKMDIYQSLRILATHKIDLAPKRNLFFPDYTLVIPHDYPYLELVQSFAEKSEQYYCHALLENFLSHIQTELKGFDICCVKNNVQDAAYPENLSCTLSFKISDFNHHETMEIKTTLNLCPKMRKIWVEAFESKKVEDETCQPKP